MAKALALAVANPDSVSSPACKSPNPCFPPSWGLPYSWILPKKSRLQQWFTPTSPCWANVKYNKFHICFEEWPVLRGRSGDSEKRDFCLGSSAFQALVMRILCKRGGRKKDISQMDFIQRCRELSIYLWLCTRSQEPSTSKASIRIHKSSPALSLCLSLAEHTTFQSAPRFLLVWGSGLQEPAEEKLCGSAPALPGRGHPLHLPPLLQMLASPPG